MFPRRFTSLFLAVAATLAVACGGGMQVVDPPSLTLTSTPDAGQPAAVTCGPAALCSRTIDECAQNLTQTQCEGWYAKPSNCRDMAAYVACNCDCVEEATCTDYFACGNLCFNDSCK